MAIDFGSPICTNMCRLEVKLSSPVQAGELTALPRSLPLPPSQASTSVRNAALSLRSVNSRSLCSIATSTLNRSLWMCGLAGLTSVGPGTASWSTYWLWSDSSRGMCPDTRLPCSPPGSRLKYGSP